MLDVSLETGILRGDICRHVADMEDKKNIQLLYKTEDEHTKFTAGITSLIRIYSVKKIINSLIYGGNNGRI